MLLRATGLQVLRRFAGSIFSRGISRRDPGTFLSRNITVSNFPTLGRNKMEQGFYGENHLIWIDCEMTGLDVDKDHIIEIACIITAPDLFEVARHPAIVINVPNDVLDTMNPWCVKTHGESGLIQEVKNSTTSVEDAEQLLLKFVQNYTKGGSCPMAGNSIHMDRVFIRRLMPEFHKHFHYRSVDVSTLKELVRRWNPKEYDESPKKKFDHRSISDIEASIAELQYYRQAVFKK